MKGLYSLIIKQTTRQKNKPFHALPGFSLSFGITVTWVGFIIVIPLLTLFISSLGISPTEAIKLLTRPAAIASFRITFIYAMICAIANTCIGLVIAWTLVKYPFKGSRVFEAIIDLPFAIPGSVGGIALAAIFGKNGIIGKLFYAFDINLIYNQFGIIIGLIFITLPFGVRSIQPLVQELSNEEEHAAYLLGATKWQIFWRVQFPYLVPGIFSSFLLSFSRSIGEYGTVIFLAGNVPLESEVVSRYIYNKIDQYDLPGAILIATTLLVISLVMITVLNFFQYRYSKKWKQ